MYETLMGFSKMKRKLLAGVMDAAMLVVCVWLAFALWSGRLWPPQITAFAWLFLIVPLASIPLLYQLGFYRSVMRYINTGTMYNIVQAMTLQAMVMVAVYLVAGVNSLSFSLVVIYWMLGILALCGSRVLLQRVVHLVELSHKSPQRVVIYGAGSAGVELVRALESGCDYLPVAFVDDKKELHGNVIQGMRVYPTTEVASVLTTHKAALVLLAIPSASRHRRRCVLEYLEKHSVSVRTVPALADLVSGKAAVKDIQEVKIEDILGREPVLPDPRLLFGSVKNKTVMVTGAGGSIGSELSRQILELRPKCLVLFEASEYALYQIERELRSLDEMGKGTRTSGDVVIVPALGTVTDQKRLEELMKTFHVNTVYHAAAYKHVPLVEFNPIEGVKNNVFGTIAAAQAARSAGVENFVLISTDKAVRPTSVMGATKRVSELILQAMHIESDGTPIYSMVRFGNVLASSGSVVPLFKEQIAQGGPVTVTHPDMTRYFMTIPEAAQLVIQASSLAVGGDVFVLDMGKPVRILDLATEMISLSGLRVWDQELGQGDIKIAVTGQRPGEKLHEELLLGNNITQTSHPRIMRAHEEFLSPQRIGAIVEQLRSACSSYDTELVIQILETAISEFVPPSEIAGKVWLAAMRRNIKKSLVNIVPEF